MLLAILALLALAPAVALYHVYTWPHAQTRAQRKLARAAARHYPRYRQLPAGGSYNYWLQYTGTPVASVGRTPTRTWQGYHA